MGKHRSSRKPVAISEAEIGPKAIIFTTLIFIFSCIVVVMMVLTMPTSNGKTGHSVFAATEKSAVVGSNFEVIKFSIPHDISATEGEKEKKERKRSAAYDKVALSSSRWQDCLRIKK